MLFTGPTVEFRKERSRKMSLEFRTITLRRKTLKTSHSVDDFRTGNTNLFHGVFIFIFRIACIRERCII